MDSHKYRALFNTLARPFSDVLFGGVVKQGVRPTIIYLLLMSQSVWQQLMRDFYRCDIDIYIDIDIDIEIDIDRDIDIDIDIAVH